MVTNTRTYNITEYATKALEALNKMEKEQKAGQSVTGGKKEVILAIKDDIKALIDKGYTVQQISEALKTDVFGILPKTITEIVINKKQTTKKTVTKASTKQITKQATDKITKSVTEKSGTFKIKADSEDI